MPTDNLRAAVAQRMSELGLSSYTEWAERAGIKRLATVSNLMTGKTEQPRDSTLAQLGAALGWPADWLEYVRRGEPVPDVRPDPVDRLTAMTDPTTAADRVRARQGLTTSYAAGGTTTAVDETEAGDGFHASTIRMTTAAMQAALDAGLDVEPRGGPRQPDYLLTRDGEPVAAVELKMSPGVLTARWRAYQEPSITSLRTYVTHDHGDVPLIVYIHVDDDAVDGDVNEWVETLGEYGVHVQLNAGQLRAAVQEVAD